MCRNLSIIFIIINIIKNFFFAFSSWSVNSLNTESKPYFSVHDVQERDVIKTELGRKGRRERGRSRPSPDSGLCAVSGAGAPTVLDQTRGDFTST